MRAQRVTDRSWATKLESYRVTQVVQERGRGENCGGGRRAALEKRGGLLGRCPLTMAGAGQGAVPRVDASGWSSFRARGTTAHCETVLRL